MKQFNAPKRFYIILVLSSIVGALMNVGLGIFFYNQSVFTVSYTFVSAAIFFLFAAIYYLVTKKNSQLLFFLGSVGVLAQVLIILRHVGTDSNFHIYLLLLSIITILTIKTRVFFKVLIALIPLLLYVYFEESVGNWNLLHQLDENTTNIFNISNYLVVVLIYLISFLYYYQSYEVQLTSLKQLTEESKYHNHQKTNFISRMSHEIRNPMNGIIGLADLLAQEELPPHIRQYVTGIQDSSSVLISIVNDILDISKIDAGKFDLNITEFNLNDLIKGLTYMTKSRNRNPNVDLVIDVSSKIDSIYIGDGTKLRQVFTNLIDNAFKFTSSGHVKVKIDMGKTESSTTELLCIVEDTGIGIKEEDVSKLFKSYEQVYLKDHNQGGSGLGLVITKKIVELMGGRIRIESKYGLGTKVSFNVFIKRTNQPFKSNLSEQSISRPEIFKANQSHALIVDDNHINASVLSKMLNKFGITTDVCYHGLEALHMLKNQKKYDLMIFDHVMPDISGIDLIKDVRQKHTNYAKTPIISLTASAFSEEVEKLRQSGFDQVLIKPVTIQQIENLLKVYLYNH